MEEQVRQITGGKFDARHIAKFFSNKAVESFSCRLNRKTGTVNKDAGKEYWLINQWDNEGLISTGRDAARQWRKFSLMDMIWLDIIEDLREFGFGMDKIRKVKEQIQISVCDTVQEYPLLEFFVFMIISEHLPVFLKVSLSGDIVFVLQDTLALSMNDGTGKGVVLTVNDYVRQKLPTLYISPCFRRWSELDDSEAELIEMIREGIYQQVGVKLKDGRINLLEGTERIDARQTRIVELLKSEEFQNIELKQELGKVVSVCRTVKRKM